MTREFIQKALSVLGASENTWVTLDSKVQRIGLIGDTNIPIHPLQYLFDFDSSTECLYICKLTGVLYNAESTIPEGCIATVLNGNAYLLEVCPDYLTNTTLPTGCKYFHTVISYDQIVAFYNTNINAASYLEDMRL